MYESEDPHELFKDLVNLGIAESRVLIKYFLDDELFMSVSMPQYDEKRGAIKENDITLGLMTSKFEIQILPNMKEILILSTPSLPDLRLLLYQSTKGGTLDLPLEKQIPNILKWTTFELTRHVPSRRKGQVFGRAFIDGKEIYWESNNV